MAEEYKIQKHVCLLHNSICSFIVLMSSGLLYNVENNKSEGSPLNEKVFPKFGLVLYISCVYT